MNRSSSAYQILSNTSRNPQTPFSKSQETGKWLQTYANGTCTSDMEFRDSLHLRYCGTSPNSKALRATTEDESSNTMTKSSLSFKTLPPEFSSRLLSATNHKSTQIEAQMLKRPMECLYQQKNLVIYKSGVSGNTKLIAFWLIAF